jgi:predicted metal-dependent phosphoesterase TrpH
MSQPPPPTARPGPAFADLHLHTLFSDGTFTPEELAAQGARFGLAALALTDHDTVEGCARLDLACRELGLHSIAGAELTAEQDGNEVHILGYFLDAENARLQSSLKKFQGVRQNRIHEMVARLNRLKIPLRAETVFAIANCHSPGRPHVGRALVQGGFCGSLDEAFDRFLKKNRPAYVPKFKISALEAIELVHQAGGLASLLVTGGSDCHGYSKGKPLIGGCKLPAVHYDRLIEHHRAMTAGRAPLVAVAANPP